MKISFRQGIIRYQRDPSGLATFLKKSDGGSSLDLIAANDPTIVTMAYRQANYLHEEARTVPRAWTGFESNVDYWLYIELDMVTAQRAFGSTKVLPTYGSVAPKTPMIDQHWFDVVASVMKVWNGISWTERTRVFVAQYAQGSIIVPTPYGTQVNVNTSNDAGFILFDSDGYPVRQHHKRKSFEFLTTSSVFNTVTAKAINVSLDAICVTVQATEPLPAFTLVARDPTRLNVPGIKSADCSEKEAYAVGIIQEDFWSDETGIITQHGYVTNEQWNFTDTPGTPLFLGVNGTLTASPAQKGFIQRIGEVVSAQCVRVDIQPPTRYVDSKTTSYTNVVPLVIDKVTGEQMLAPDYNQLPIKVVNSLLEDASKLPVTALGGSRHLLEEWTANFTAEDQDHQQRITALEMLLATTTEGDSQYDRDTPMTIAVGGAIAGTTFQGTVQDALDKILYPFGVPKFSTFVMRDASTVVEIGATIPGGMRVFNWTTVNPMNIKARSIAIADTTTNVQIAGGLQDNGITTAQIGPDITNTAPTQHTWTISAVDTQNGPLSKSFTVAWRWKIYYGSSDLERLIGTDVLELPSFNLNASAAGSYVMGASGYKWLCYPSSYPTLTLFRDQATGMNIAVNDPILVSVTNSFGLTQQYKCHRTYNTLGSSITVVGS